MWRVCHQAHCPRLDIAQQNAEDAREAHMARAEAQRVGERFRERMAAARAAEARNAAKGRAEALAALKSTIAAAHPDRGGSSAAFRKALDAWRAARRR